MITILVLGFTLNAKSIGPNLKSLSNFINSKSLKKSWKPNWFHGSMHAKSIKNLNEKV